MSSRIKSFTTAMALDWGAPPRTGLMAAKDQTIKILAEISQDAPPRGTRPRDDATVRCTTVVSMSR